MGLLSVGSTISFQLPASSMRVASWPPEEWTPKMIVFDKDGTLGDCTQALKIWCNRMTEKIIYKCLSVNLSREQTNFLISSFYSVIGWSVEKDDVVPSAPLSAGSWADILDITAECLSALGLRVSIDEVSCWHESMGDIHNQDPPLINTLPNLLTNLRSQGIVTSICTSDDRSSTTACIRNWQIEHLVDYSICGDEVEKSEPSRQPLFKLCQQAGVMPHECMVVGDTSSDMGMGLNGGAGLIVGVLTGSGTKQQLLDTGAHVVLPDIGHLEDLLRCLPPHEVTASSATVPHEVTASSATVVSVDSVASIASIDERMQKEEENAASLLVSMKSEDHDSL
ncbi:hypothetical protein ACHAWT_001897 [Skeletonema menzelii]